MKSCVPHPSTPIWQLPFAEGPLEARAEVPGSKSEANRALVLAALSDGPSRIVGLPTSRDTSLMTDALVALGADIQTTDDGVTAVTPPSGWRDGAEIDCGLAGTVMRFVPPVAMLAPGPNSFHGDPRASERPLGPLLNVLRDLGSDIVGDTSPEPDALPFTLYPPDEWVSRPVTIDASASSQFVSGLLLAAARFPHGIDLRHVGETVPSRPHIDMTVAMLAAHGVRIDEPEPDHWIVQPGILRAADAGVEPDLTNGSAFLLAGVLTGGWVEVAHWPERSTQPGDSIKDVIASFGGWTERRPDGALRAGSDAGLTAADVDLSAASELTPVVAALAAVAKGTSRLTGIGHIRGHETDRLAAIADALGAVGVSVKIENDGLVITGGVPRHGGVIDSRDDHRMVHLAALLGLVTPGVSVLHPEAVAKTMPDFQQRWVAMTGRVPLPMAEERPS